MFPFRDGREAAASSQTMHAAVVIALFVDARRFFFVMLFFFCFRGCVYSCVSRAYFYNKNYFLRDESRHQRYRKNNFRIKRVLHFEYDGQTPLDFGEIFFRTGRLIRITQSRLVGDG